MGFNMIIAEKGFSKFTYRLCDLNRSSVGILTLPTYLAVPKNGWASGVVPHRLQDRVQIQWLERDYRVEYALLSNRALHGNDLRFLLMDGDKTLASTNVYVLKKTRWEVEVHDRRYDLVKRSGWLRMRFDLAQNEQTLGHIRDVTGFALWKRTFEIDLPAEIQGAVQVFIFFLSVNATFR